ncbi:hypothetical protein VNO80_20642 [Phaseolus coccineus]|uniref:Dolichol phosphate-mannose biosynthesis regulatory protein n=1 Tax=Phaseolus coccineus TaxID=3886 RepID=A0AAN9QSB8_PHACN
MESSFYFGGVVSSFSAKKLIRIWLLRTAKNWSAFGFRPNDRRSELSSNCVRLPSLFRSKGVRAVNSKMELADRAVGFVLSVTSLSIFTYYTFWVIILPFVDDDHFVHKYFLPQEYAILIPVSAGVALLCFFSIFVGFVMLKSKRKKA